jgi:hypothetical protein
LRSVMSDVAIEAATGFMTETMRRIQEDQNRADFMEFLYELDGRGSLEHPHHHTYTGLFQDFAVSLGMAALRDISDEWHVERLHIEGRSCEGAHDGLAA